MFISLLALTLLASSPAQGTPPIQPSGTAEIAAFVEALNSCTEAKAATPHPLMRTFVIEHTIAGAKAAGCDYTQTMPGNMKMACMLSAEGRKALASEMSVYVKGGSMSGSTSAAQPVWFGECELETADGKRQPMARPRN